MWPNGNNLLYIYYKKNHPGFRRDDFLFEEKTLKSTKARCP